MKDHTNVITAYVGTVMKAWFQYRVDAVLRSLAVFLRESTGVTAIWFALLKFDIVPADLCRCGLVCCHRAWRSGIGAFFLYSGKSRDTLGRRNRFILYAGCGGGSADPGSDFFVSCHAEYLSSGDRQPERGILLERQKVCRISCQHFS